LPQAPTARRIAFDVLSIFRSRPPLLLAAAVWFAACGGGGGGAGTRFSDVLLLAREDGIVELDLAKLDERLLIPNPANSFLFEAAVSPDGQQIAYAQRANEPVAPGGTSDLGLDAYVADRDGSNPRLVRQHRSRNELVRSPAWLPGGDALIVSVETSVDGKASSKIERVELATGTSTVLLQDGLLPALSEDGRLMVFTRRDANFIETLWLANADGSDLRPLVGPAQELGSFSSPRFSPDGSVIVFGGAEPSFPQASRAPSRNGIPMDLWEISVTGDGLRRLADMELDLPSLAWSGDGARLFVLDTIGLFVLDPAAGAPERLTEGAFHAQLDWASAGE